MEYMGTLLLCSQFLWGDFVIIIFVINNLPDDHNPSRRSRRLNEDLPEDRTTAPGQSMNSRRKRMINYNDQDDEDLDLVPGPLLQENNQDTVNMPSFLLYF